MLEKSWKVERSLEIDEVVSDNWNVKNEYFVYDHMIFTFYNEFIILCETQILSPFCLCNHIKFTFYSEWITLYQTLIIFLFCLCIHSYQIHLLQWIHGQIITLCQTQIFPFCLWNHIKFTFYNESIDKHTHYGVSRYVKLRYYF